MAAVRAKVQAVTISPLEFFSHLRWIDERPLMDVIEPYRQRIFMDALYTFGEDRTPHYNLALTGRGKKNWKSADLILAALYRFLAWESPQGNDCFLLANDEGQAGDDLKLLKKVIAVNPLLDRDVIVKQKEIERVDAKGTLKILPAQDAIGAHGKTYLFVGFDEIHGYRNWDIFEALAPDPTRLDALTWITSYASIYNSPGNPLFDLMAQGKRGEDPRMYFSWYSSEYCTDPDYADAEPEARANPSMPSWGNPTYLAQQRRRLPSHKFRRLHLNLPGMPDGAFLDAGRVTDAVVEGRKVLRPVEGVEYSGFVDMSGGSSDDAALGIAHWDTLRNRAVLDLVATQTGKPPFNPRDAVRKFAGHPQAIRYLGGDRRSVCRRDIRAGLPGARRELPTISAYEVADLRSPRTPDQRGRNRVAGCFEAHRAIARARRPRHEDRPLARRSRRSRQCCGGGREPLRSCCPDKSG